MQVHNFELQYMQKLVFVTLLDVMQSKEQERRLNEQKERALAMAQFQQRSIKDEPTHNDSSVGAFPAPQQPTSEGMKTSAACK